MHNWVNVQMRDVYEINENHLKDVPRLCANRCQRREFTDALIVLKKTQDIGVFWETLLGNIFLKTDPSVDGINRIHNLALQTTKKTPFEDISDVYRQLCYVPPTIEASHIKALICGAVVYANRKDQTDMFVTMKPGKRTKFANEAGVYATYVIPKWETACKLLSPDKADLHFKKIWENINIEGFVITPKQPFKRKIEWTHESYQKLTKRKFNE